MKTTTLLGALALTLTTAACADPFAASPPDMTPREAAIARYKCDADSNLVGLANPIMGGMQYAQCMRAHGFGPAAKAAPRTAVTPVAGADGWPANVSPLPPTVHGPAPGR